MTADQPTTPAQPVEKAQLVTKAASVDYAVHLMEDMLWSAAREHVPFIIKHIANVRSLIEREAAALPERHYDGDECGDPDHEAIMQAWYVKAERLLGATLDVPRLRRAIAATWPAWGPVVVRDNAERLAAEYARLTPELE